MEDKPNRYGAQGITDRNGVECCCHGASLADTCDGCVDLEATDREPTLVGVDPCRMNPLNDDGAAARRLDDRVECALEDADDTEFDDYAEEGD